MIKKIALIVVVVLIILVGVIAVQPSTFHVERSISVSAPPAIVFEQVNDFHKWEAWCPWKKFDPNAKETFDGPPAGTGTICTWSGNNKVGEGSMMITNSQPNERIDIKLDFKKPMKGTNDVAFVFKPVNDQTNVTWSMTGHKNFVAKAIGLVMKCEKMIGSNFEEGLANLKSVSESEAKQ